MPKHVSTIVMIVGFLALLTGCENPSAPASGTASPNPAPLQLSYDDALAKGVAAARAQQFQQAADFFTQAHKANPASPEALFDLGLAEAKIPGRELRAMAWFQAYLALSPDAPNAAAVREQIKNLDTAAQANTRNLVNVVSSATIEDNQQRCFAAHLAAASGDFAQVQFLLSECKASTEKLEIPSAMAEGGDVKGAFGFAASLKDGDADFYFAYTYMIPILTEQGEFADARHAIDLWLAVDQATTGPYWHLAALQDELKLAAAEYQAGRSDDARALIEDARNAVAAAAEADTYAAVAEMAIALQSAGRYDEANSFLQKDLAIAHTNYSADDTVPYRNRMFRLSFAGKAAFQLGNHQQASSLFKEALDAGLKGIANGEEQYMIVFDLNEIFRTELDARDWDDARAWIQNPPAQSRDDVSRRAMQGEYDDAVADEAGQALWRTIRNSGATAEQRAQAWSNYVDKALIRPIFVNYADTVQAAGSATAKNERAVDFMASASRSFQPYVDALADIRGVAIASAR